MKETDEETGDGAATGGRSAPESRDGDGGSPEKQSGRPLTEQLPEARADRPEDESETSEPAAALKSELLEDVRDYFEQMLAGDESPSGRVGDVEVPASETEGATERGRSSGILRFIRGQRGPGPADEPPAAAFVAERWFDLSVFEEYRVDAHYWVQRPFAHVSILYDPEEKRRYYYVNEPVLNGFERHLRNVLVRVLRSELMYRELELAEDRAEVFAAQLREVVNDYAATVNPGTVHKLIYFLVRDFLHYGEIDPLMRDDDIEDISCDGEDIPVYVFHSEYRDLETNIEFDANRLSSLTVRLAQMANKQISVADPLVDGTLPDGSRIQLTLGGDVANRGSNFTIRNFSDIPLTPIDLINYDTFSVAQMAYFWLAIENGRSLIFAGGTGSGKTTSMNAVSFFIPPDSKVVSIEDTLEVTLPHTNWVQSTTRKSASATGRGEVSMYELLQSALRQRPEYILVGEIRTDPNVALTFFQAIGTGHTAYTTFHADSVEGVLSRLQNPPLEVPVQMLRELDIVSIQKQVFLGRDRVRRNDEIAEFGFGSSETNITPTRVFERDAAADTFDRVGDSGVLAEIAEERGWDETELADAIRVRERILSYMIEHDITDYRDVAAVIHTFFRDPEFITTHIQQETLRPAQLSVHQ